MLRPKSLKAGEKNYENCKEPEKRRQTELVP
jgi:hypothetical protein